MFEYGKVQSIQMDVVCLDWRHAPLREDCLPAQLPTEAGVYAFQGCHDSRTTFGVLYVGQADNLAARVPRSLCERLFWRQNGRVELYSDVWHPSLFVATLERDQLARVEAVLIAAHSPAFNNIGVRGTSFIGSELKTLLVLNGGRKGALLPAVCGAYYDDALWP